VQHNVLLNCGATGLRPRKPGSEPAQRGIRLKISPAPSGAISWLTFFTSLRLDLLRRQIHASSSTSTIQKSAASPGILKTQPDESELPLEMIVLNILCACRELCSRATPTQGQISLVFGRALGTNCALELDGGEFSKRCFWARLFKERVQNFTGPRGRKDSCRRRRA
jgi:hypothetical protein